MQKPNIMKKLTTFVLALALSISLLPTTAYAENDNYDGTGTGQSSATQLKENGASVTRQFIRMYVIETEHGHNYTEAVDVILGANPSGYYTLQDIRPDLQVARVTPSVTSVERQSNNLGIPNPILWTGNNFVSNAAEFKEWMMTPDGNNVLNIEKVIQYYFGEDVLDLFKDTTTEKALIIENGWYHGVFDGMNYQGWKFYGTAKDWVQMQADQGLVNGGFTRSLDNGTGQTALMLAYPILGIDTDFPIYSNITHDVFSTHGYGLHVYYNDLGGQTTCDEPQMPTPHASAQESSGKVTIVKSYRVKDSNGNMEHVATTSRSNLNGNIQIENEAGWNVVGWRASSTVNTGVTSVPWNAPSDQGEGNKAQKVNIKPNHCLYVLLEKTEENPVVLDDYEYKISQSRITKRISMSNPDNPNGILEKIVNTEFTWKIDGHVFCGGPVITNTKNTRGTYDSYGQMGTIAYIVGAEGDCGCLAVYKLKPRDTGRCYFFACF